MKTNWLHYLTLIYFVNQLLRVSSMFIAHHLEVFTVFVQQLVDCRLVWRLRDYHPVTPTPLKYEPFVHRL
jgi:hypothetical protein